MSGIEPLLSVEAAAEVLSISPWTVRAYLRRGKRRAVRIGRRCLIEPEELRRFIADCRDLSMSFQRNKKTTQEVEERWLTT